MGASWIITHCSVGAPPKSFRGIPGTMFSLTGGHKSSLNPDPAGLRVKPTLKKDCCGFAFLGNINGTKKGNATEMKLIKQLFH